jgi:acyl-CoA thioesterase FadM
MDLGRVDLLIRTGLGKIFFRHKWKAVLGAANIRFRQALRPFQEYLLYTRIMGFDEKWAYLEQRFESKGELVAYAIVKGVFIDHEGRIPMPRILNELGLPAKYPPLPKILQYWSQMDDVIKETFNPKQT